MKAIAEVSAQRRAILDEYRIALRLWSETKALYPTDSDEVARVTKHLMELETMALALRNEKLAAN